MNGRRVRDVLDVQFQASEEEVEFLFRRGDQEQRAVVWRAYGEDVGLEFSSPIFDGIRECANHCPFCFVRQLPQGLRRSLYLRDDDYRLSFLQGSFITLTNLTEADWRRLEEQRLSPLYVSVHATDPRVRAQLLGRRDLPPIMGQLRRLIDLGITLHTQIVVVPQVDDGEVLSGSLADLEGLFPGVASIGVVPVGLTHCAPARLRRPTPAEAEAVLELVHARQAASRRRRGVGLVYAADEWYLMAGLPIPPADCYDGYPQRENGIGLVRLFLQDWEKARTRLAAPSSYPAGGLHALTGELFAPVLRATMDAFSEATGIPASVTAVPNQLFGESVSVAGLLGMADIVRAARTEERGAGVYLLPRAMFDAEGTLTLDDGTSADIEGELGRPVWVVETMGEVASRLGLPARKGRR